MGGEWRDRCLTGRLKTAGVRITTGDRPFEENARLPVLSKEYL
jgi:hypothetical protein